MRRRQALAAAVAALAVGLSGCGIPDETEVRDIGPGPDPGYATSGGTGIGAPDRSAATSKEQFVSNFLAAAAGDPAADKVQERVRRYVIEDGGARDRVKADRDGGVNVVRLRTAPTFAGDGRGAWTVTLKVDQIGVLNGQGSVGEAVLDETTYTFKISGTDGNNSWFVTEPPPDLLLSTEALSLYYTPRTIYFWSEDRATLVPDPRYMPNDLDEGRQPTQIVDWLVEGPSARMSAVSPLNPGTEKKQNVPYPKDRLEVAFNAVVAQQTVPGIDMVAQLGQQLMWSLLPYVQSDLDLRIDGQRSQVFTKDQAFYAANAAHRSLGGPEREQDEELPERFVLYQGRIYRHLASPDAGQPALPRLLLAEGVNDGIVSAALAREVTDKGVNTAAALVTSQPGGRFKLRVVSAIGDGAHPPVETKAYASMKRPVWLKAPMDFGLVVADDNLYQFTLDSAEMERVAGLPAGFEGKVTDVSASPEGRRIVVVANGQAYLFGVSRDGGGIDVGQAPRRVPATLRDITAVDWSEESKLVVAGLNPEGKQSIWEVSIDGAVAGQQVPDVGAKVTQLVAYPTDPLVPAPRTSLMYSAEGGAFDLSGPKDSIEAGEVVGAPGEVVPAQLTGPFFLLD